MNDRRLQPRHSIGSARLSDSEHAAFIALLASESLTRVRKTLGISAATVERARAREAMMPATHARIVEGLKRLAKRRDRRR